MTKEELKALGLTDEQVAKISEDYGKNYVAKPQFNAKNDELKALKGEVEALKGASEGNKELQAKLEQLQAKAEEEKGAYEKKIQEIRLNNAIESAIKGAKGRDVKAISPFLNLEGVKLNGETVEGLKEQIEALQKEKAWLFDNGENKLSGVNPATPPAPKPAGLTRDDFKKMSYTEQEELFKTNQELYNELTQ